MATFNVKLLDDTSFHASLSTDESIGADFADAVRIYDLEVYTGDYEITPSEDAQVLDITNKMFLENITIKPIPQNYGRISYNGYSLTVT